MTQHQLKRPLKQAWKAAGVLHTKSLCLWHIYLLRTVWSSVEWRRQSRYFVYSYWNENLVNVVVLCDVALSWWISTEIFEELDKASGSSCESIADKLLILVTSMPTAFITKPTLELEQVW